MPTYDLKKQLLTATKEGIVVNPPELGNLSGQGEVTYTSQVQDVLIPYTTREDSYNYYEERNYVNDVNREHTEVLETYDHDGKARETYSYGQGRASYLNNQTGDSYNYLTNQSGSVTGLTKDGQAVASTSYNLYGARKTSTDTTGQPFAYNGEARDDTGLDYLRARYYDSQGGTFLSEDSYPGEATAPLSQNRYSYVQNNPVNYTDPSGHFWNSIKKGWNYVKSGLNWAGRQISRGVNWAGRQISRGVNWVGRQIDRGVNWVGRQIDRGINWVSTQVNRASNWVGRQWNEVQTAYNSASDYVQQKYQQAAAQIEAKRQQVVRSAYALATGLSSSPTIREGMNLLRNWGTALQNTLKHICTTAERVKNQVVDFVKHVDWKKVAIVAAATVAAVAVSVATAGAAAPVVAGLVGSVGLTGFGAAVATGVGVGVIAGAAGGGTQALVSGVLSGKDSKTILKDTLEGIKGGAVTGAFTGGLTGGLGAASSSVTNSLVRHGVDTVGETVIDTISDATQGGQITPTSIGTSLLLNAVTEGVSSRTVRAPKADVVTTKPTGGRLPMTVENLQMFAEKPKARPTWKQSEIDVGKQFPDYSNQKSYLNGQEVPYGTKGSVRPEYYNNNNHSVEVKNYNLENKNGKYNLVNNVTKQVEQRVQHLPSGSRQTIFVDIRGQKVSDDTLNYVFDTINNKTSVDVEVIFKRD